MSGLLCLPGSQTNAAAVAIETRGVLICAKPLIKDDLEASYHDFGTATAGLFPCPPQMGCIPEIAATDRRSTDAWSLRVAYRLGEDRWQPFAALGWVWSNTDGHYQVNTSPIATRHEESDNGLSAEVGVRALLGAGFAVRAGYEWFELEDGDGALNLGVEYAF